MVYKPPDCHQENFNDQLNKVKNYYRYTCRPTPGIILLGYFNFPN